MCLFVLGVFWSMLSVVQHREIFEIFLKYFMKYFMKYFRAKKFTNFYITSDRSFDVAGPRIWSKLPASLCLLQDFGYFRKLFNLKALVRLRLRHLLTFWLSDLVTRWHFRSRLQIVLLACFACLLTCMCSSSDVKSADRQFLTSRQAWEFFVLVLILVMQDSLRKLTASATSTVWNVCKVTTQFQCYLLTSCSWVPWV